MARKATKKTTREQQYRDILEPAGIRIEDCEILAFRVARESGKGPEIFHYDLMARKPSYYLFDCFDDTAVVVAPKDKKNTDIINDVAAGCGGVKTSINMR